MSTQKRLFPGQRDDEHIITILRSHWLLFVSHVFQLIGLNLFPIALVLIFIYGIGWEIPTSGFWYVLGVLITSMYYCLIWLMYYHAFVDYHLDIWILTDQRIINIEQKGLFDRVISELNITKVQDVTSEIHGHIQTIFDYGNVYVQTAAEQQRFAFLNIPNPEEVSRLVVRANDAATKRESLYTANAIVEADQKGKEKEASKTGTNEAK